MLKKLFTNKPTEEEIRKEQYVQSLKTITEHFNGVRVNETLLGRIRSAKMDDVYEVNNKNIKLQSSVPRPKVFTTDKDGKQIEVSFDNNLFGWFDFIREEAKRVINKNKQYAEEEKKYQEELKTKHNEKALKEKREFLINYGLLPKQQPA